MKPERVLVTVKTYPTLSRKYGETVCTAGIRPDGSWVRIYPVPFRRLDQTEQYKKYDWLDLHLARNTSDPRNETFRPVFSDYRDFVAVDHVGTDDSWRARRALILDQCRVYTRRDDLITDAKNNVASLAVFKPTKVLDFVWEEAESREWEPERLRDMREATGQHELFADNSWRETFQVIPKLPYRFFYIYEDADGNRSRTIVIDWETGQLYWNCLRRAGGDEQEALAKVREKYMDQFLRTDLHFFMGTTQQFHFVAPNPWLIIGVLQIPHDPYAKQGSLF